MSKPSPLSRSSISESLVESSSHETPAVDEQPKSPSPPVMKTKTKREAYKASSSSSSSATYTGKNHDIGKSFKKEIEIARQKTETKEKWEKFSKQISTDGVLTLGCLNKQETQDIVEWFKTNPKDKIIKLDLDYTSIGAEGAKALADMLKTNTTITAIELSWCNIGANGAKAIAEAVVGNPNSKITTLYLDSNWIGTEGIKALIEPLKANATITTLGLGANYIGNESTKSLAKMLETDKTITSINLEENVISGEGFKALATMLKINTSITAINISNNDSEKEDAETIVQAIIANPNSKITSINLAKNKLRNEGAISIVKTLIANPNSAITAINLSYNQIGDRGVEAIAKALVANPNSKITNLNLGSNWTTREGEKFIKIIDQQCALNAQKVLIENNIAGALDLLTANPNPNDGHVTSVRDVNDLIAQKLFALDKADKLNTDEVKKDPSSVFNKYT